MTAIQKRAAGITANPAQGMRVERGPQPTRLTEAGRIALSLRVHRDGMDLGVAELVMTHEDAAQLVRELHRLLSASTRKQETGR
ncbi:hypothetical protein [Streptomyces sp. RFCAC02]|uniref:hypothetical protein n=1 Tax=Streptomyces sp. RFCAC02 TaxID=2499143 RepID=UPI001F0D8EB2|nr:hypothetical protein [Streptomyces sp. RFCAC02]